MGTLPSDNGLSWLAVLVTDSVPPSDTSHTQPEPNWPAPVSSNFFLKSSSEPNADSMADATSPLGSPPPSGLIHSQNLRVVQMAATLVADGGALVLGDRIEVGDDVVDAAALVLGAGQRRVQLVHVGLVVLVVVEPHRLLVDVRFEGGIVVGQRGNLKRHRVDSFGSSDLLTC